MDMIDFTNRLLSDMAAAQSGVRFVHAKCGLCTSTPGRYSYTMGGVEFSEVCHSCNGKGTIIVECEA